MWAPLADRFVCINLLERDDRLEQAKKRFAEVGLADLMTYHRVARHSKGGRFGCYESHRACIEQAYRDGLNSVLIFEDDVLFNEGWEQVIKDATEFTASGVAFDTLFLGSKIIFVDEQTTDRIWRVKCFEAHAYIVSRSGMKAYLDGADLFDRLLAQHGQDLLHNSLWQNMYSHCSPSICQDDALGTDHIWIDYLPLAYAEWMQLTVTPKHKEFVKPLVRFKLWQRSWIGRRYVFGIDNYVINDGRVSLKGLWMVDAIIHIGLMFVCKPPFGYWVCFKDIVNAAVQIVPKRLSRSKCEHTKKES